MIKSALRCRLWATSPMPRPKKHAKASKANGAAAGNSGKVTKQQVDVMALHFDRRKHDLRDYEEIEVVTLQLPQPKKGYQWACEMGANSFKEYHRRVRWDAPYPLAQPAKKELKRGMSWEEARKRSVEPEWLDARVIAAKHAWEKAVALSGSLKCPVDVGSDSD